MVKMILLHLCVMSVDGQNIDDQITSDKISKHA